MKILAVSDVPSDRYYEYCRPGKPDDFETIPHMGFECFHTLMDKYEPSYFIHGHIHRNYDFRIPQRDHRGKTTVINAFEYAVINTEENKE